MNETTVATCIATGTKTFTCACGASYTETIPVNSSNHVNKTNVAATASTCTGKVHTGPFGWLIKFFHSILAIFKR